MTVVALTTFIELTDASGAVRGLYQNSKVGSSITLNDKSYSFLSFIYQGAAKNRTGDNLQANLVLASNALSMNYVYEAVQNRWNVRVDSCSMNPETFTVGKVLTTEYWIAAGLTYDAEVIEVLLSSSIDAVGTNAPTRVLTKEMVGSLPTTANIQNR